MGVRRGNAITLGDGSGVEAAGADEVFVVVVNTAMSGNSRRPGLCIGAPDEVSACQAAMAPDAGAPDAGTNGGGDASVAPMADAGTMPPAMSGCGCTVPGHHAPSAPAMLVLLGLLGLVTIRRR